MMASFRSSFLGPFCLLTAFLLITGQAYPEEIEGRYFFQEEPDNFLELRPDRTAAWICRFEADPERIRWKLSEDEDSLYLYSPDHLYYSPDHSQWRPRWKREFVIKGDGILVRSLDGSAWVKEGKEYVFSYEELSGTYKRETLKMTPALPLYNKEVEV